MNNANAILFLGSGATAASGITNLSQQLPTDGQFFGSRLVETFLTEGSGGFPAIRAAREKFKIENPGLYFTWNSLFMLRSFSLSGVLNPELPPSILTTLTPSLGYPA
jgi:hypothetical protein